MTNFLHQGDLPADLELVGDLAVDSETMGLNPHRDRLCVVQLSDGNGDAHLVRFAAGAYAAPRLKALLADPQRLKIYHYARFDIAAIQRWLGIVAAPVYCTKIASKLCRTYTDRHSLKDLTSELLGVQLDKQQQSSDWGADTLSPAQISYAASDVLYLHGLRAALDSRLAREGRTDMARAAFQFLPMRAAMDLAGFESVDIFAHS